MNAKRLGGILLLTSTFLLDRPALAAEIVRPVLVVRTYHATPIHAADWSVTLDEATHILGAAGIEVQWVHCGGAGLRAAPQPSRCTTPFRLNEVAIRVVRLRTSPQGRELPLGESLLDGTVHAGTLATIYVDRVEWLARAGRVNCNRLLGRAIAHELGHLLLGTTDHSTRGLMRPVWTRDEVMRRDEGDWAIPPADSARMREAYDRRSRFAMPSALATE